MRPIAWREGALYLIDQRRLPCTHEEIACHDVAAVAHAIRDMVVRGAPAIGITAAYGVALAARERYRAAPATWKQDLNADLELLAATRPTAVNLFWALERMRALLQGIEDDPFPLLLQEAQGIHEQDIAANHRMGELGAALIETPCAVLTHCNAGALATGGYGTALGVIRAASAAGRITQVYADETRPWLQGARLTAWELLQDGIPVTLLAEGAAAHLMKQGGVGWVIVGSDRIAANGDVANKIGTYSLAVAARHHGLRFMVVAPTSTIDMNTPHGDVIPIESRTGEELLCLNGQRVAAEGATAWNPVFDVTPAELVDAIVTEKGVVKAPDGEKMAALMGETGPRAESGRVMGDA
ncbi:MAG: S-methyl-5-thioribose-1-phosphate isomerase [Gammaproteobacteria bacterium]